MIFLLKLAKLSLKTIYPFFKLFPKNPNKITFLSRQTNEPSIDYELLAAELQSRSENIEIVMLCKRAEKNLKEIFQYSMVMIKSLYHIATSNVCILDTYWPAVSLLNHKKSLTVIQMWHAMGKIKKSGYQNLSSAGGRTAAVAEEINMHKNYDLIIAGGEFWNPFYCASFGVDEDILYNVGLPRVDYLIHNQTQLKQSIFEEHPDLRKKPLILYAPTWRKTGIDGWDKLLKEIDSNKFNIVVKGHPNQKLSGGYNLNCFPTLDVLAACDLIITDYSAIAVEAAAISKPTYYYLYDYETYSTKNGLNADPMKEMPSCAFKNATDLALAISASYPAGELERYRQKVLPPTVGNSTKLIANKVMAYMEDKGHAKIH